MYIELTKPLFSILGSPVLTSLWLFCSSLTELLAGVGRGGGGGEGCYMFINKSLVHTARGYTIALSMESHDVETYTLSLWIHSTVSWLPIPSLILNNVFDVLR